MGMPYGYSPYGGYGSTFGSATTTAAPYANGYNGAYPGGYAGYGGYATQPTGYYGYPGMGSMLTPNQVRGYYYVPEEQMDSANTLLNIQLDTREYASTIRNAATLLGGALGMAGGMAIGVPFFGQSNPKMTALTVGGLTALGAVLAHRVGDWYGKTFGPLKVIQQDLTYDGQINGIDNNATSYPIMQMLGQYPLA